MKIRTTDGEEIEVDGFIGKPESKKKKIDKLIKVGGFDDQKLLDVQLQTTLESEPVVVKMFKSDPEGAKRVRESIERLQKLVMAEARKLVHDALEANFTEKEIDDLIAIYANPIYKKFRAQSLTQKAEARGQEIAKVEWPKLEKMLTEMMVRYKAKEGEK